MRRKDGRKEIRPETLGCLNMKTRQKGEARGRLVDTLTNKKEGHV